MKKRIVAGAMAAALLVGGFSFAESSIAGDLDLTALSYDDLLQLSTDIKLEMIKRAEYKETKYRGIYTVGIDLPAGRYRFTFHKDSDAKRAGVIVYSDKETYQEYYTTNSWSHNFVSETLREDDNLLEVSLEDGNILIVTDAAVTGIIYAASGE